MANRGVVQYTEVTNINVDDDVASSKMENICDVLLTNLQELSAIEKVVTNPNSFPNPLYRLGTLTPVVTNAISTSKTKMGSDQDIYAMYANTLIQNSNTLLRIFNNPNIDIPINGDYIKLLSENINNFYVTRYFKAADVNIHHTFPQVTICTVNIPISGKYKFKVLLNGTISLGKQGAFDEYKIGIHIDNIPYLITNASSGTISGKITYFTNKEIESPDIQLSAGTYNVGLYVENTKSISFGVLPTHFVLNGLFEISCDVTKYQDSGQSATNPVPVINVDEDMEAAKMNLLISNLKAVSKAFDYINSTGMWKNDYCAIGCQVACQDTCKLACQSCHTGTCHNQNCGGWS